MKQLILSGTQLVLLKVLIKGGFGVYGCETLFWQGDWALGYHSMKF